METKEYRGVKINIFNAEIDWRYRWFAWTSEFGGVSFMKDDNKTVEWKMNNYIDKHLEKKK